MSKVYLLTGSNLGDRLGYLKQAKEQIQLLAGDVEMESGIYESEPWGFEHENNFLNQVLIVNTKWQVTELLTVIHKIESKLNRERHEIQYVARTIDIDILFYDDLILNSENLTIPHPKIQDRKFTLLPLAELSPEFIHPVFKKSIKQILKDCKDNGKVWR